MARPKVILFGVNEMLLDFQPMKEAITKLCGGGPEAARLWFTTLLQHSLVLTVADRFADFSEIGAACLRMIAKNQGVDLSEDAATKAVPKCSYSSAWVTRTRSHWSGWSG